MMDIIPAIDLINGKCVRLIEGDYSRKTEYSDNPVELAQSFESFGIKRLHVVDLEGARLSRPVHIEQLKLICSATKLSIDFGGGIREAEHIEKILAAGATQVNLGSMAVNQPDTVKDWIKIFGAEKFFMGADVLDGFIATKAWSEKSVLSVNTFIQTWIDQGVNSFFSTDVRKDGRLEGPSLGLYKSLVKSFPELEIVASGGVSCLRDIQDLDKTGVGGVIVGKALFENRIQLSELKPWIQNVG